jgi:hypothetical protein
MQNCYYKFVLVKMKASAVIFGKRILAITLLSLLSASAVRAQYCPSSAYYTADEDIYNVTFGSLNNTSDCNSIGPGSSMQNLYSDYSSLSAPNITAGSTVPLSIEIGSCNPNNYYYDNMTAVFIDYNRDGTYAISEMVYISPTYTNGPHIETANVVVPTTVSFGLTGMRVINIETTDPTYFDGCVDGYLWGETEDYTINLEPNLPPTCVTSALAPLEGNTLCTGSTTLRWNKKARAAGYDVYVNTGMGNPITIVSANQVDTFYTFTTTANDYVWKVIPKNAAGSALNCTGKFSFKAMNSITPNVIVSRTPTADTLCPGTLVTFTASPVLGGLAPAYQWIRNGVAIGTNSTTYSDSTLTASDSVYAVITTSITGSCVTSTTGTSAKMRIKYRPGPNVDIFATGINKFCDGGTVTLNVTSGNITTQWLRNGNPLSNATGNSYVTPYSGMYSVYASAPNGCTQYSKPFEVTVYNKPNPALRRSGMVVSTDATYTMYQWRKNGVDIPGANSNSYTFSHNGFYSVTVTDTNGCSGTSSALPVNELSIKGTTTVGNISFYPNPATDKLYINGANTVDVKITGVDSKVLITGKGINQLDIHRLPSGIYMIHIADEAGYLLKVGKFIKE